jgi:hypothetical protein
MADKEDRSRTVDRATGSAIIVPQSAGASGAAAAPRPGSGLAVRAATVQPGIKEQKERARGLGLGRFTSGGRKAKK